MRANYSIREAAWADLEALAPRIHWSDREVLEAKKVSPFRALQTGLEISRPCMVGLADEEPICAFGAIPMITANPLDVWASVWFMAAEDAFEKHGTAILRRSARWIEGLDYDVLWNASRSDNDKLVFWLGWLGFDRVAEFQSMSFPMTRYRRDRHV